MLCSVGTPTTEEKFHALGHASLYTGSSAIAHDCDGDSNDGTFVSVGFSPFVSVGFSPR